MKSLFSIFVLIVILVLGGNSILSQFRQKIDNALSVQPQVTSSSPTPLPTAAVTKNRYLFVPYWSLSQGNIANSTSQTLVYFGVAANTSGLDEKEAGYTNLKTFVSKASDKDTLLTIRMINNDTNFAVLKDKKAQEVIIQESIALAKKENFKGIVLNLELSALPFDSLVEQINNFNKTFYEEAKEQNLFYYITAYGDSFYRVRPFDIPNLAKNADGIFIMAYDFHKAKGNPGPNFPLKGKDQYGYDMEQMLSQFTDSVDSEKLTVIFGLYGYDWKVNEKNVPIGLAEPRSMLEMESNFITSCQQKECKWERDGNSEEMNVTYVDTSGGNHTVWFEDETSVKRKEQFLNSRGITSFAYWAHSYF